MTGALLALTLAAPRFVAPGPDALTTQPTLHVFVEARGQVALTVNGQPAPCRQDGAGQPGFGLKGGLRLAHCRAALRAGRNSLVATEGQDAKDKAEQAVTRYVTTGPLPDGVEVNAGFGPGALHRPETEALCRTCHRMAGDAAADAGTLGPDRLCADCHQALTARKSTHGPAGQVACLACHDAASAPARFAVRWPIEETCFGCHADLRATMDSKAFRHGPAAAGRCTTCHDPHGSDEPYWLKKHAFELCTTCHDEKRDERHVVVGFVYGDSHPLKGRAHPLKPGAEFACPACHNPHAAQARFLWQFDVTQREKLCRTCHLK